VRRFQLVKTRQQAGIEGAMGRVAVDVSLHTRSDSSNNSTTGLEDFLLGILGENIIYAYPADVINFCATMMFYRRAGKTFHLPKELWLEPSTAVAQFITTFGLFVY
jgi:hypothetical protein